jgi:adenylate cyclase
MKKRFLFYLIPFLSTALFVTLQLRDPQIIREQIESKTYDLRLSLRNLLKAPLPPNDVVIVVIDEKSVREIGRWPWRRDVTAELIDRIADAKPKVIGIDIMFTERESAETDERLAMAIKRAGNIVLATRFDVPEGSKVVVPPHDTPDFLWDSQFMEVKTVKGIPWKIFAVKPESIMPSLAELSSAAMLGHVYSLPDLDGSLRFEILYLNYGDDCYPQFALQIARLALDVEMKNMILYGGAGVKLGDRFIPTDLWGRVVINYRGKEHTFEYLSASDVIKGRTSSDNLRNKVVLVGTSALATYDQKVTPFSANMPGVEKNANVVSNILHNDFIRRSPGIMEVSAIIFTGILLGLVLPRLKAISGSLLALGVIALYVVVCCYLLIYHNIWANLLYPVTNMVVIFTNLTITK